MRRQDRANQVDAPVQLAQSAGHRASAHRSAQNPELEQLCACDHTMLSARQFGNPFLEHLLTI
jgi:hypothetical protein